VQLPFPGNTAFSRTTKLCDTLAKQNIALYNVVAPTRSAVDLSKHGSNREHGCSRLLEKRIFIFSQALLHAIETPAILIKNSFSSLKDCFSRCTINFTKFKEELRSFFFALNQLQK